MHNTELSNLEVISQVTTLRDDESVHQKFFEKQHNEDRRKLDKIGQSLTDKSDRLTLVKKPRHEVLQYTSRDTQYPHLKYFYSCQKHSELVMPVLEKVVGKTIHLDNYAISEGVC